MCDRVCALAALFALACLAPAAPVRAAEGKKYALLIGVTEYDHSALPALKYAENDAERLAEILAGKGGGFATVRVLTVTRGKKDKKDAPTKANIDRALDDLLALKKRGDLVLVALSGHGIQLEVEDPDGNKPARGYGYFCPTDADFSRVSYSTGKAPKLILMADLIKRLGECGAGAKLLLADACRNELKADSATRSFDTRGLAIPEGVAALFSCRSGERAWETAKLGKGHGVFFHHVLAALKGEARDGKNQVRWSRMADYVVERVSEDVPKIIGGGAKQTPHEVKSLVGVSPVLVGKALSPHDVGFLRGMDLMVARGGKQDAFEAAKLFRAGAKDEHALCQAALAWLHQYGVGAGKDWDEAVRLSKAASQGVRAAAEDGNAEAMVQLAMMHHFGRGVEKDVKAAMRWYRRAAALGHPLAINDLGWFYRDGMGVEKDEKEALRYFRKAADMGLGHAMINVGNAYRLGQGVERDDAEALRWYRRAAEKNYRFAQFQTGLAYLEGRGVAKDTREARRWLEKAAAQGWGEAKQLLERIDK